MKKPIDRTDEDADLQLPRELVADLRALYARAAAVPPAVDEAIVAAARDRARDRRVAWIFSRRMVRWIAPAAAAGVAAAAVLLLSVGPRLVREAGAPASGGGGMFAARPGDAYDINGDGHVDILDAYRLSRAIRRGEAADPRLNVNGDEAIDDADVRVVALAAVSLKGADRS
ncbi:MAG: hypothetical protein HYV63_19485 [Candidatus Schekmanbacteria bacterium]|nr:hypothetical protein [Candidatus Schekmanbacteria bacterium]